MLLLILQNPHKEFLPLPVLRSGTLASPLQLPSGKKPRVSAAEKPHRGASKCLPPGHVCGPLLLLLELF